MKWERLIKMLAETGVSMQFYPDCSDTMVFYVIFEKDGYILRRAFSRLWVAHLSYSQFECIFIEGLINDLDKFVYDVIMAEIEKERKERHAETC